MGQQQVLVLRLAPQAPQFLAPRLQQAQARGWHVRGPYPADTLFQPKYLHDADCVLAMYHDQGLIPFKTLAFEDGVNFTAGLSIVRTSPDHGTAFDLAGKGVADPSSLLEAMAVARMLTGIGLGA